MSSGGLAKARCLKVQQQQASELRPSKSTKSRSPRTQRASVGVLHRRGRLARLMRMWMQLRASAIMPISMTRYASYVYLPYPSDSDLIEFPPLRFHPTSCAVDGEGPSTPPHSIQPPVLSMGRGQATRHGGFWAPKAASNILPPNGLKIRCVFCVMVPGRRSNGQAYYKPASLLFSLICIVLQVR